MTNSGQRQPKLLALGDAAVLIEFSDQLDLRTNTRIQVLAQAIRHRRIPWIRDVVPALATLAVHVDPVSLGFADPIEPVRNLLTQCLNEGLSPERSFKQVRIPICYETEFGLDLDEISQLTGLSTEEVVHRHQCSEFMVLMVGFAPGHPYLGGLAPSLSVPRRSAPRVKMPCGAVAIANAQCVVYPFEIPGGWSVVGRTPLRVFDANRQQPSLFEPGAQVRFDRIDRSEFDELARKEGTE
jgi:KipI family sensor histidine kinase inhibitor